MTHLTKIIGRVKRRFKVHENDLARAAQDSLFRQSVGNLKEFQEAWPGRAEKEEIEEANKLYDLYHNACSEVKPYD